MGFNQEYNTCHGLWEVTTERDCEGGVRRIGVYEGHIDDIAFALAGEEVYALRFKKLDPSIPAPKKAAKEVNVSLDIDSGTWDWAPKNISQHFRQILRGRKIDVKDCQFHACATLVRQDIEDVERAIALSKLTPRERALLGLDLPAK